MGKGARGTRHDPRGRSACRTKGLGKTCRNDGRARIIAGRGHRITDDEGATHFCFAGANVANGGKPGDRLRCVLKPCLHKQKISGLIKTITIDGNGNPVKPTIGRGYAFDLTIDDGQSLGARCFAQGINLGTARFKRGIVDKRNCTGLSGGGDGGINRGFAITDDGNAAPGGFDPVIAQVIW